MASMRTTIDGAGRIAMPKEIRDRLCLEGGEELEVRLFDGTIEIRRGEEPRTSRERRSRAARTYDRCGAEYGLLA